MKRWLYVAGLLASLVAATPGSAGAQADSGLDVVLERDPRPGVLSSALVVNLKVTVSDADTMAPPDDTFEVYAFADQAAGSRTEIFPCAQEHDNSPDARPGVYLCTVLLDHGGRWRFSGVVNQLRDDADDPPVTLARTAAEFDIVTNEVAPGADDERVEGRLLDVALLWGHAAAAAVWLGAVGLVATLALPALRRRLSTFGRHRLEDRFELLVKSTWTATGLLVATGSYLLLNQTAYETPFSSARIEAAFRLPYGRPYFLALAAKLAVYAVMVAASMLLLAEARRRLRSAVAASPPPPTFDVEVPAAPEREGEAPAPVRWGAAVLVAGTAGLSLSVTLLKYFHELIEAARGVL